MRHEKKRRGRKKIFIPGLFKCAVIALLFYSVWTRLSFAGASSSFARASSSFAGASSSFGTAGAVVSAQPPELGHACVIGVDEINDTRLLELVNAEYAVNGVPDGDSLVSAWPGVAVASTDVTLHRTAREAVEAMFAAADDERAGDFYVSSGYRDRDSQARIYGEAPDKSYAQPPDRSEHQLGLAADIMAKGVPQAGLAASSEGRWLAENSWKYGLLLRYAEDKRDITQIAGEAWHFRYIGAPHAYYCRKNGLCYEEYIQFLKESGGFSVSLGNTEYAVFYQTPVNGTISVPDGLEYEVSGDNTGGYVITAWKQN